MKRLVFIFLILLTFIATQVAVADDLFQAIKNKTLDSLRTQATPVVQAFGQIVGGGLYHTASTHGTLGFDVGVQAMSVIVPKGESAILDNADLTIIPLPVLQANLGLPMGFGIMARGIAYAYQGETFSLFGVGVKKDFKSMIPVPMFPHVGVMVAYQSFKGGEVISANVVSFDLMASKSFVVIEPYIGVGFDRTSMNFTYTISGTTSTIDEKFTESATRFTLGLKFSPFPLVQAFADFNVSKFKSFTAGLAVSFR